MNAACKRDAEIKIEKNNLKSRIVEKKYYTRIRIPDIDYRYSRKLEEEKLIKIFSTSTIFIFKILEKAGKNSEKYH